MAIKQLGLALLIVAGIINENESYSKPTNLKWFPKDDGLSYVPGFVGQDTKSTKALCIPGPIQGDPDKIHFNLYTKNNPSNYDEITNTTESIDASHWDRDAPVKIFSHGFSSSGSSGSAVTIKKAYIDGEYPNVNLIIVDWGSLAAAPWYDVAASGTQLVGQKGAYLLDFLVSNGYTTPDKIHALGHSLGSHVSGFIGRDFQALQNGDKIARITGLDPALPRFGALEDDCRLDPTDASFVDVIHTAAGTLTEGELAFTEPRGHVDFYPNSGHNQPGCGIDLAGACSHSRCYEYYVESLVSDNFRACKCLSDAWVDLIFGSCSCENGSLNQGEWVSPDASGIYYLETNSESPYALG